MSLINKGGKKKRRGKNLNVNTRPMEYITEEQQYGLVLRVLGNGRFLIKCFPKDINNMSSSKDIVCSVRGKMRRRIYVNLNDIVIISLRDFQVNKGDIIHKYTYDEANILKKKNLIPDTENMSDKNDVNFEEDSNSEDEDINIDYEIKETQKYKTKNNNQPYFNFDMMPNYDSDESYNEEDDVDDKGKGKEKISIKDI